MHGVDICRVIGRLAHAIGLSRSIGSSFGRTSGMMLTFAALLGGAGLLLWRVFCVTLRAMR